MKLLVEGYWTLVQLIQMVHVYVCIFGRSSVLLENNDRDDPPQLMEGRGKKEPCSRLLQQGIYKEANLHARKAQHRVT